MSLGSSRLGSGPLRTPEHAQKGRAKGDARAMADLRMVILRGGKAVFEAWWGHPITRSFVNVRRSRESRAWSDTAQKWIFPWERAPWSS